MGYTHYFYRRKELPKKLFAKASQECSLVCAYLTTRHGFELRFEYDEADLPLFVNDEVRFNGVGEDGGETFQILQQIEPESWERPFKGRWFSFCKTGHRPYDCAVCACLIVFQHYFPKSFVVSSDGEDEDEGWVRARAACQEVLGYGEDFMLPVERLTKCGINLPGSKYPRRAPSGRVFFVMNLPVGELRSFKQGYRFDSLSGRRHEVVRDEQVILASDNLRDVRLKAAILFLKKEFEKAPGVNEFTAAALASPGDWTPLLVWADRIGEEDPRMEAKLRAYLPARC